jgi:tetratricopeptide (TPR) repeat protein
MNKIIPLLIAVTVLYAGYAFYTKPQELTVTSAEQEKKEVSLEIPNGAKPGDVIRQKGYTITMLPDTSTEQESFSPTQFSIKKPTSMQPDVFKVFQDKAQAAQDALEKNPSDSNSWLSLAQYLMALGNTDASVQIWTYLVRTQPGLLQPYGNLAAVAVEEKKYTSAEKYYREAISRNIISTQYYHDLFDVLRMQKKETEAGQVLADGTGKFPAALDLYVVKARYEKELGDIVAAKQAYATAIELAEKGADASIVSQLKEELAQVK